MHLDTFITEVFCLVDDFVKKRGVGGWVRQRGPRPKLSDSEVLTMEVVGEFLGHDTEKGSWAYFHTHHRGMFPRLGGRTSFTRQAANLWAYKQALHKELAEELMAETDPVHIVDGVPLTVAGFSHARGCRVFRGQAAYGRTKGQTYYGFRGVMMISLRGVISGFTLGPAVTDERQAMWDLVDRISGLVIADGGFHGIFHRNEMARHGIELQTPRPPWSKEPIPFSRRWTKKLRGLRRLIETVLGQLAERLHFERVRARDLWHLTNRLWRKILAHTVAAFLNHRHARPLLHFDGLLSC